MSIYVINGKPGVGKDRFCSNVIDIMGSEKAAVFSTVDGVKTIAKLFGWNGKKDGKARRFLSNLKKALAEWNDFPVEHTVARVENFLQEVEKNGYSGCSEHAAVFIMCREPEEIRRLCETLNAKSILVKRHIYDDMETSNKSDEDVFNYEYDILIENNGDLQDLAALAIDFVKDENLFFKNWKDLKIAETGEIYYN